MAEEADMSHLTSHLTSLCVCGDQESTGYQGNRNRHKKSRWNQAAQPGLAQCKARAGQRVPVLLLNEQFIFPHKSHIICNTLYNNTCYFKYIYILNKIIVLETESRLFLKKHK